tara:strand:- start:10857 stop:11120 length:264 start_codon:yes stop_codon:yes gene_type:complete
MEITKEKYKEILEIQMIPYNEKSRWFEETLTKINQALQLQQTGVSTCFLEDYQDHFFEVKYKQTSCCKIAPITNENYCPNCGNKILK